MAIFDDDQRGRFDQTGEIVRNPHLPYGWRRDEPISLSRLLHYGKAWRSATLRELDPSRSPQTLPDLRSSVLRALSRIASQSWRSDLRQIWSRTIERNRRCSRAYFEDFAIEERPKMV